MQLDQNYLIRRERVMKWYATSRIGLFYHWGLFSGGGATEPGDKYVPLKYQTIEEFESAAQDPGCIARNMVRLAQKFGAKYINFTCCHGADGFAVMFPTRQPEFRLKTKKDYIGALIDECDRYGIKPIFYLSMICEPENLQDGPYMNGIDTQDKARELYGRLIEEIGERYNKSKIGGFWLDCGFTPPFFDFPAFIRKIFPEAVILVNSSTFIPVSSMDFSVTEFLATDPVPPYNRPSGLTRINNYSIAPPPDDFNEDIPCCGSWWYWENGSKFGDSILQKEKAYIDDPYFLLKQMICSLGQCGQWNFSFAIPVRLDGTIEDKYIPMFDKVENFLKWGSEAIYNTTGGKFSPIRPGYVHGGAFCSVTVSLKNKNICYVHVTELPEVITSEDSLNTFGSEQYAAFFSSGCKPARISDLRTGDILDFDMSGGMGFLLRNVDWSDIETYGVKVIKVEFS